MNFINALAFLTKLLKIYQTQILSQSHKDRLIMQSPKLKVKKYAPLVISGCSGVGKGTLIDNLLQYFPELFQLSVSYTTRKARATEKHGKHYFFIGRGQFQELKKKDIFIQHCHVHGEFYGTHSQQIQQIMDRGKICILDIDIQGAEKVQEKHPNWHFIFIQPPSIDHLKARIDGRGMNTPQDTQKRLSNAQKELKRLKQLSFYKVIINDKMQTCYDEFIHHINFKYQLLIQIQKK